MSNYTITTDFGAKDSLPSSNSAKVVRGSEFTTEFTNIQTAIATKADTAGDTFTGVVNFSADVAVNTNTLFVDVSEAKVLVGKTSDDNATNGLVVNSNGYTKIVRTSGTENANTVLMLNRKSTDGAIAEFRKDDAVVGSIGTASSGITFASGGTTERMRIDSTGNVGIGTTNPIRALHVNSGNDTIRLQSTSTNTKIEMVNTTSTTNEFGFLSDSFFVSPDGTEAMRIKSSGNVGIGTTSPATALHIDSSGATALTLQRNSGASSNISIKYDGVSQDYYTGVASVSEDFVIGTSADLNGNNLLRVTSAGNVGIGTTTPTEKLHIVGGDLGIGSTQYRENNVVSYASADYSIATSGAYNLTLKTNDTERMRIDSSGNLLVGTTADVTSTNAGVQLRADNTMRIAKTDGAAQSLYRLNSNGDIINFYKDGSSIGSIGARASTAVYIDSKGTTGTAGLDIDVAIAPRKDGALSDGQIDLGTSAYRFEDIYRSGSTYSTSDRNKKQDIRDLTDAEARVATVAKGSLKAFRYIDSVEAEGDEANIHFGIIAQDLKAAFEAEGLNANDYQVFKTSTYTDDDGVEQTTYSICYENLLAFIIAAI